MVVTLMIDYLIMNFQVMVSYLQIAEESRLYRKWNIIMINTNSLRIIYGDGSLGFKGNNFHYIFNYHRGGLESLVINNKEWLYREPRPTFWRATTDNDRAVIFRKNLYNGWEQINSSM